jgi:hypothetical protein
VVKCGVVCGEVWFVVCGEVWCGVWWGVVCGEVWFVVCGEVWCGVWWGVVWCVVRCGVWWQMVQSVCAESSVTGCVVMRTNDWEWLKFKNFEKGIMIRSNIWRDDARMRS